MSGSKLSWEQAVKWLRTQEDRKELVLGCYYDDPIEYAAERYYQSEEWKNVKKFLGSVMPCKVLDVGAGRGISSYAFAKEQCEITALEPYNSDMLGFKAIEILFKKTKLPVKIINEFGENLPFENETFDIVYGRAVFHHAKDLYKFCAEAARVLKKGGLLFLTREHVISKKNDKEKFLNSHPLHKFYGGENAYLLKEYTNAIIKTGLKIKKTLSPFATPINYAPMTELQFDKMIRDIICEKSKQGIARSKFVFNIIKKTYIVYNSLFSNNPGRLYSFLASKT